MNIVELEELLRKRNISASNRLICNIWGMDEASYSRKKKALTEVKQKNIEQLEEHFAISLLDNASDNCVDLDYFSDVWASCGTGAVVFEETSEKLSVPTSIIQNYSKSNKYSVINARGDSMVPFLQDRDKLIVEHWNGGQIIDNCIYVFRYANELFVKRLVKNITQIVIKSDNPLYEPIKITDKDQDFEVIGQIVGLMRDLR